MNVGKNLLLDALNLAQIIEVTIFHEPFLLHLWELLKGDIGNAGLLLIFYSLNGQHRDLNYKLFCKVHIDTMHSNFILFPILEKIK